MPPVGEWISFDGNPCHDVGAGGTVDVIAVAADGSRRVLVTGVTVDAMAAGRVHVPPDARFVVPAGSRLVALSAVPGEALPGECPTGTTHWTTFP